MPEQADRVPPDPAPNPVACQGEWIAGCRFLLLRFHGPTDDFRRWCSLHPLEVGFGERLSGAIRASGPLNFLGGHQPRKTRCFLPEVVVLLMLRCCPSGKRRMRSS